MQSIRQNVRRWFNLFSAFMQAVKDSRFLLHTTCKLRRFWLVHFRKKYVQRQLLLRHGDCRQCGVCCNMLFTCPMLTRQGKCLIYDSFRPRVCKVFPIDQRDIGEVSLCGGHCGYYFEQYGQNL